MSSLRDLARAISAGLAASEAIWSLIHSGVLMVASTAMGWYSPVVAWTTAVPGAGSSSASGWTFEMFSTVLPASVRLAPSQEQSGERTLTDPDLFLSDLGALHEEVSAALRDAIECFRRDLMTPTVAMLGKAAEAAWSEFAGRLVMDGGDDGAVARMRRSLDDPRTGLAELLRLAPALYARSDLFGELQARSAVSSQAIADVAQWSEQVRDARNIVHYRVVPRTPNTFEKVAALLLGAAGSVRALNLVARAPD